MRILSSRSGSSRFLLWAMFLNMAFGMAAHHAMHAPGGKRLPHPAPAVVAAPAVDQASDATWPAPAELPGQAADSLCLGCHALSQLAAAAAPPPAPVPLLPPVAAQAPPAPPAAAALPRPGRWRFASRDPPTAA